MGPVHRRGVYLRPIRLLVSALRFVALLMARAPLRFASTARSAIDSDTTRRSSFDTSAWWRRRLRSSWCGHPSGVVVSGDGHMATVTQR